MKRSASLICFLLVISLSCYALPLQADDAIALSPEEQAFLAKVQEDSFLYFRTFADAGTGLIHDVSSFNSPASIAATGFALAVFAIAQRHGWMGYRESYQSIDKIFKTLEKQAANKNGFYYHFLDAKTGRRAWGSEASSIDTALLMTGVLLAGQYFKGTDIYARAEALYEKVNWEWMLNGSGMLSHGWKPENGFLPHYWDMYSEHLILQALALGSPTHPIPVSAWNGWDRLEDEYNGRKIVYSFSGSLFTYQFSHAFIDFRKLNDRGINYFENSKQATLANREFCIDNQVEFPSYSENIWGLSASLGPDGYKAYGAKPGLGQNDGTIAPYAIASSLVFTPRESLDSLAYIYQNHRDQSYGQYGFRDAFNLERNWSAQEYLGIDQGILILMIENFLTDGAIWKQFMALRPVQTWIQLCGLAEKNAV